MRYRRNQTCGRICALTSKNPHPHIRPATLTILNNEHLSVLKKTTVGVVNLDLELLGFLIIRPRGYRSWGHANACPTLFTPEICLSASVFTPVCTASSDTGNTHVFGGDDSGMCVNHEFGWFRLHQTVGDGASARQWISIDGMYLQTTNTVAIWTTMEKEMIRSIADDSETFGGRCKWLKCSAEPWTTALANKQRSGRQ